MAEPTRLELAALADKWAWHAEPPQADECLKQCATALRQAEAEIARLKSSLDVIYRALNVPDDGDASATHAIGCLHEKLRKAEAALAEMRRILEEARKLIDKAPEDTWSYGKDDRSGQEWPIRDELVYNIDATLARHASTKAQEEPACLSKHADYIGKCPYCGTELPGIPTTP